MKIAFITSGNPNNQKGMFNNVQERASRILQEKSDDLDIDFYMIRHRDSWLFSLVRQKKRPPQDSSVQVGLVQYQYLWVRHTLYDYILTNKCNQRAILDRKYIEQHSEKLQRYDLIMSHGAGANYLAYTVYRKYGVPYITSWHGSDINLLPFRNKKAFYLVRKIIENASKNLFVSKALLKTSDKITETNNKEVLYTGPADYFYPYTQEQNNSIKEKYGAQNKKVMGFIGNFVPVKNIEVLPEIYSEVKKKRNDVIFWIVGNGPLGLKLKNDLDAINADYKMFGKLDPDRIPEVLNGMDVLILPSLHEGLPRVTLEALACKVPVVGSNVGGIPEVIGEDNVFNFDGDFINNIAGHVEKILRTENKAEELPKIFSWKNSIDYLTHIFEESINQ